MKYILTLALALICLSSFKKDKIAYSSDYNFSLQKWREFKGTSTNSYIYNVAEYTGSPGIIIYYTETTITVVNGLVVNRNYVERMGNPSGSIVDSYTEQPASIGLHTKGAAALTLDEVYLKAKNEWLNVDKDQNEILFTIGDKGLLASAGYTAKNCTVNCFRGITINKVEVLTPGVLH